ncbi:hypothetical protein MD484_g280, partial [Candolleomyces efflorescens]
MADRVALDVSKGLSASNLLHLRGILNDIQRHPCFYDTHKERLAAADLAFFSHGASLDDGPRSNDTFHQALSNYRQGTNDGATRAVLQLRMKRAIFDLAATLDQMTGGSTLVISMPGALIPGSLATPEYIKANVYAPKTVIREIEAQGHPNPIPDIVQTVIREIGVPTVRRFDRARERHWGHQRKNIQPPKPLPELTGMPSPIPAGSCRYVFYGKKLHTMPDPSAYFASDTPTDETDFDPDDPEGYFSRVKPRFHDYELDNVD